MASTINGGGRHGSGRERQFEQADHPITDADAYDGKEAAKDEVGQDENLDNVGRVGAGRHDKEGNHEGGHKGKVCRRQLAAAFRVPHDDDEDGGPLKLDAEPDAETVEVGVALESALAVASGCRRRGRGCASGIHSACIRGLGLGRRLFAN